MGQTFRMASEQNRHAGQSAPQLEQGDRIDVKPQHFNNFQQSQQFPTIVGNFQQFPTI